MSYPKAWVRIPDVTLSGFVTATVIGFDRSATHYDKKTKGYVTRPLLWVKIRIQNPDRAGWSMEQRFEIEPDNVTCINTEAANHYNIGDKIYRVIGVGFGADQKLQQFKEDHESA